MIFSFSFKKKHLTTKFAMELEMKSKEPETKF